VQVLHDVLGLYDKLQPKFARQYVDAGSAIATALESYVTDVATASFPAQKECFTITDEQYDEFIGVQIAHERKSNDSTEDSAANREAQLAELMAKQRELAAEVALKQAEADLASLEQQVTQLQAKLLLAEDGHSTHRVDSGSVHARPVNAAA